LSNNDLETVAKVELDKYLGKWYEIAHLPAGFQNDCNQTTATYSLLSNGNVSVLNECIKNFQIQKSQRNRKIVDKQSGAKLKVTFFWPFYGDYWIIKLGTEYDYAVVGTPNRKYLWVLSRTPSMDKKLYSEITEFVKSKGFNTDNLILTIQ
jgi:apolipoprotein D and lipocalin family protein